MHTRELESLIQFWKDSLAQYRLLISPSTVYLVEQTIKRLGDAKAIRNIEDAGLFVARLNNDDWMVGKASYIYHIEITQNHYADPNVSISPNLGEAIAKAVEKIKAEVETWSTK